MKKYTIVLNFLLLSSILLRENINVPDSLISYYDITHTTKFEAQVVNRYIESRIPEYFKLFLAPSEDIDSVKAEKYLNTFNIFYENLTSGKFLKFKPKRKIKTIYRTVHNKFLKKYELLTTFDKIFKNGEYNCVTASALYGVILHRLNIPFFIIETPIHVYIVSYPDKNRIKIESGGPYAGYFVYTQSLKRDYIEYYKRFRFIDEEEYSNSTIDDLFDKYYFSGNKISLEELIGIHYLNISVYNYLENKPDKGYNFLEKAYLFNPSEGTRILLFNYLNYMVTSQEYDKLQDLNYLLKLSKFSYHPSIKETIISEFLKITEDNLINTSNTEYYDSVYNYLSEKIINAEYLKDIALIYNYEKGKFLFNNDDHIESHDYFKTALELKFDNENVQSLFMHSLKAMLNQYEISAAIEILETYSVQFQELLTIDDFILLIMKSYLIAAFNSFESNNITSGDEFLEKFENLYKSNSEIVPEDQLIGEAYSAASVYFFKKGFYDKAKEYLIKGLNYAPENKSLKIGISSF